MEWISVKEHRSLPDFNKKVILYGCLNDTPFCRIGFRYNGPGVLLIWKTTEGMFFNEITHWSPLPDQPERSKREDSECFVDCKTSMRDPFYWNFCLSCEKNCKPEMRCSEHDRNIMRDK